MSVRAIVAMMLLGLLAACNVGPDYHKPDIAVPAKFSDSGTAIPPVAQADLSQWWTVFRDAELNSLITRALAGNLDLQTSASRVRQAREQEIIVGAAEWPTVDADAFGVNVHSNSNPLTQQLSGGAGGQPSESPTNIKLYSLAFDASWEPDLFGGTRRAVESAKANTEAARWEMHDGEVALSAEIANDYLTLRATQMRIALLEAERKDQRQLFDLVRARRLHGFVTQLDVDQQRTLLSNTEAQIPALDAQARAMVHAIAVLLAEPPESLDGELGQARPLPAAPEGLPTALPSNLLRRRPDIREAERRLAAATAQEGVAIAELYPKFELIGAPAFTGSRLSELLSSKNFGTVGIGTIEWPIFEAGKLRANIRSSKEAELQSYLAYQNAVLGALRDVEDALARYRNEERHVRALEEAVNAAESSDSIARQQFANGLVTYINVLTAETSLLSARDQLVQGRQALAQDRGALYKALGGGWNEASVDWKIRPPDPENN